jgi:hypothetical protein
LVVIETELKEESIIEETISPLLINLNAFEHPVTEGRYPILQLSHCPETWQ